VCTTISTQATITGSGKDGHGWFRVDGACLGYDHPSHVSLEHAILIDFVGGATGSTRRLAVELSLESARTLAGVLAGTIAQAEQYERTLDEAAAGSQGVPRTS
jgi:hypothetical protein